MLPPASEGGGGGQGGQHGVHGQTPADDAGGAGQHLGGREAEQGRGGGADRLARLDAAGGADVGDLVVDENGTEFRFGEAAAADDDGRAGEGVFGEDGGEVRGGGVESDERKRHLGGLGRFLGDKFEAGGADAKALRQGGLLGEPGAVGVTGREGILSARHARISGWAGRKVKGIFGRCGGERLVRT